MEILPPEINQKVLEVPAVACNRLFVHVIPNVGVRITFGEQIFSDQQPAMRQAVVLTYHDAKDLVELITTLLNPQGIMGPSVSDNVN